MKLSCIGRDCSKLCSEVFHKILDVFLTGSIVTSEEFNFIFVDSVKNFW